MSQNRIPLDPKENLSRMTSIVSSWKVKLEGKKKAKARTEAKLARLQERMAEGTEDEREARSQQVVQRKFHHELHELNQGIRRLGSKIYWAEKSQIPFIKSEVKRQEEMEAAADERSEEGTEEGTEEDLVAGDAVDALHMDV